MSDKKEGQRLKILKLLHERGSQGATNAELNKICFRFSGRIYELRQAGYDIKTQQESASIFRFVLKGKKPAEQLKLIA